ncbi:MAG: flagellar biosynthesis protein FliQ [Planctomycetota bacterium]|jgi:flagellar biosynthetic protein FliQ
METQNAVDLVREAILMALTLSAPLLLVALTVGLVIGLLQTLTQVQDQTLTTIPKLMAMAIGLAIVLPWMTDRMVDYSKHLIREIPAVVSAR